MIKQMNTETITLKNAKSSKVSLKQTKKISKLAKYYPDLYYHIKSLNLPNDDDNENDSKWKNSNWPK